MHGQRTYTHVEWKLWLMSLAVCLGFMCIRFSMYYFLKARSTRDLVEARRTSRKHLVLNLGKMSKLKTKKAVHE